jgi:nucleoside phosphorylase
MKVLVVHDRPNVAQQISDIFQKCIPSTEIVVAEDGVSARGHLARTIFDLRIIDLTLPHIKGGNPDYRVADDLLKELFSLDSLNIPGDVIGLTKDPEALALISTSLGPHVMVTIHEDGEGVWQKYLADKIQYASRAAVTRQVSVNQHYMYDALILTALDEEFEPYRSKFDLNEARHFAGAYEFVFSDRNGNTKRGIAYSIGKSGQARAASSAQSLITFFRPKLALMSGFCGGVKGKCVFGDLMIFESSYDWDYGKWSETEDSDQSVFLSRANPISIDGTRAHRAARNIIESDFCKRPDLLRRIELKSRGKIVSFEVDLCPAASGSAVVTNNGVLGRITGLNDAIKAVDMESYGFYFASSQTKVVKPEFICMKAVADFCNGEKGDDLHEACSEISASAVAELITKKWDF